MALKLNRQQQLQQLRKKYSADLIEFDLQDGTLTSFVIHCSDPNYTTELIHVAFKIPFDYPENHKVEFKIVDKTIGELAKNSLETAFLDISTDFTLLRMSQWIDRQLPSIINKKIKFIKPNSEPADRKINSLDEDLNFAVLNKDTTSSTTPSTTSSSSEEYQTDNSINTPHKGVMLSFPFMELKNIALIDVCNLSIYTKCTKCKSTIECINVLPSFPLMPESATSHKKSVSCIICGQICQVIYRPTFAIQGQGKIGYLDLINMIFKDLLASHFRLQCEACSEILVIKKWMYNTIINQICQSCHKVMQLDCKQLESLSIGTELIQKDLGKGSTISNKKQQLKKEEGLKIGEPLPKLGVCSHYKKSNRWLRFPCCNKAYPCDICHDTKEDHSCVNAPKQICGFCSQEQNSNLEYCKTCGKLLAKTHSSAFWEGGKGTRDTTKMSRKDNRKHKGKGKVKSNAAMKKKS